MFEDNRKLELARQNNRSSNKGQNRIQSQNKNHGGVRGSKLTGTIKRKSGEHSEQQRKGKK